MISPLEQHVSEMLTLASSKYGQAIDAVKKQPDNLELIRAIQDELADTELLIEDCLDITGDQRLADSLSLIREQQKLLAEAINGLEQVAKLNQSNESPWLTPWPWISSLSLIGLLFIWFF